jgi:hypothetical protein
MRPLSPHGVGPIRGRKPFYETVRVPDRRTNFVPVLVCNGCGHAIAERYTDGELRGPLLCEECLIENRGRLSLVDSEENLRDLVLLIERG